MSYQIYKISNINNDKYYIGIHSGDIFLDNYWGSGVLIKSAIKKYGIDDFKKEIIIQFDDIESALLFEKTMVNTNEVANPNCYNLTEGGGYPPTVIMYGDVNPSKRPEVRKKISEAHKGIDTWNKGKQNIYSDITLEKMRTSAKDRNPISEETKQKIRLSLKGKMTGDKNPMFGKYGDKNPNYGNSWTAEQKKLQSEKLKGRKRSEETLLKIRKPILQYDIDGNFIKEWISLSEAANTLDIYVGCINNCLRNRSKSSYGFVWKYKNLL